MLVYNVSISQMNNGGPEILLKRDSAWVRSRSSSGGCHILSPLPGTEYWNWSLRMTDRHFQNSHGCSGAIIPLRLGRESAQWTSVTAKYALKPPVMLHRRSLFHSQGIVSLKNEDKVQTSALPQGNFRHGNRELIPGNDWERWSTLAKLVLLWNVVLEIWHAF